MKYGYVCVIFSPSLSHAHVLLIASCLFLSTQARGATNASDLDLRSPSPYWSPNNDKTNDSGPPVITDFGSLITSTASGLTAAQSDQAETSTRSHALVYGMLLLAMLVILVGRSYVFVKVSAACHLLWVDTLWSFLWSIRHSKSNALLRPC